LKLFDLGSALDLTSEITCIFRFINLHQTMELSLDDLKVKGILPKNFNHSTAAIKSPK
jgi:hypothetical protein